MNYMPKQRPDLSDVLQPDAGPSETGPEMPGQYIQNRQEMQHSGLALMDKVMLGLEHGDDTWDVLQTAIEALYNFIPNDKWYERCQTALLEREPVRQQLNLLVLQTLDKGRNAAQRALDKAAADMQERHDAIDRAIIRYSKVLKAMREANEEAQDAIDEARRLMATDAEGTATAANPELPD